MKKILILKISILLGVCSYSQRNTDLLYLKNQLIKKGYLFHSFKKEAFIKLIKSYSDKDKTGVNIAVIDNILSNFKEIDLQPINNQENKFFKIKCIDNEPHIVKINKEFNFLLEQEILKINGIPIKKLKEKLTKTFYLPHPSLISKFMEERLFQKDYLTYLDLTKEDSILITTKKYTGKIPLSGDIISTIKVEKELFKNRKNNLWFWSYGINFGQQVYLKFNKILSASHMQKMKDSLKWQNYTYAKNYNIPIQQTYNPLKFTDLTNKLHLKFSNSRYKKLIIDFRDTNIGTDYNLNHFIYHLKKIKRLKGKRRIYILIDKNTNGASLAYIQQLKLHFKPIVIGETCYGTIQTQNDFETIELPESKLKIKIPKKRHIETEIIPDIKTIQTLKQTVKGIDASLNQCLE